ncbi:hypothetical protein [Pseudoxanthomonas jiangsuensis]|uniref:hypothetical protein n=1 Tax=Pseudoxanthomonas jiangsuensis TaxID=619688 RepID=UPI001391CD74|nr:hypothetical protein [Pseudoxanthomonas jiangsuensis]
MSQSLLKREGDQGVQARLWYAMRVLRSFTPSELMAVAEVESRRNTRNYCQRLARAGFLAAIPAPRRLQQETTFRLVRNTGPKCPGVLLARGVVWDHNTNQEYPIK